MQPDPPASTPLASPDPGALVDRMRAHLGRHAQLAEQVGRTAAHMGLSVHLVGGGVRDLLLGRPVLDLDLVVEGDAGRLARALSRQRGGRAVLHHAFGTAKWVGEDGVAVDLAQARTEHYAEPAALPSVSPASLAADLSRRDFSINAMALSLDPDHLGQLADPHGGWTDLGAGRLRALHGRSFEDDPTRMYRAARFGARFGFRLDDETTLLLEAAVESGVLNRLGRERLGAEVDRILQEETAPEALGCLAKWGLLRPLSGAMRLPDGFSSTLGRVRGHAVRLAGLAGESVDVAAALWVALGSLVPASARTPRVVPGAQLRQDAWLKAPQRVAVATRSLAGARKRSEQAHALRDLSLAALAVLASADPAHPPVVDWWVAEGRALRTVVNGHRLMAEGVRRGPALGTAIAAAQDAAWDGVDAAGQLSAALSALT